MKFLGKQKPQGDSDGSGSVNLVEDDEKANYSNGCRQQPLDNDEYMSDSGLPVLDKSSERKLPAKIDLRLIPVLCVLHLLAFLDRVNIGNAAVFGLADDLHLEYTQFKTALAVFFVPYTVFEIPSNVLLKKLKPHVWLSINMFMFGLVSVCQGLVSNYGGLLTARFFLGLFETGMFPGCLYLISMWYRRPEAQKRYSFFFGSTTIAGAFGGLLASAIGKLDGIRHAGWRWIFILEGTLTCIVAVVWFFLIPDFPEDAKWLSEQERIYVKQRLATDQGKSALEKPITLKDIGNVFKDFKIFIGGFMYFGLVVPGYGFAYFAPTIIQLYGEYSPIETQLHSVPPWAAAWVVAMATAALSDRLKHRYGFIIFSLCMSISGFAMLIGLFGQINAEYAALFLITMGTYSAMPMVICWFQMNLGGHHRRAVGSAYQIGFGNLGGIIAVYAFLVRDAPRYIPGYSIGIGFTCLTIISSTIYLISCMVQNRNRQRMPIELGLSEHENTEKGDLSPNYKYQL